MAGFFQDFLKDIGAGFFGNEYLRDYTHASKVYRTNAYGYSPKFKFLFHVNFELNDQITGSAYKLIGENRNIGLAVKSIQLPQFTFDTHVLNQYNRKRIVQTKVKYDDLNVTFHDDNANMVRNLWYAYYTYYYKDATKNYGGDRQRTQNSRLFEATGVQPSYNSRDIYKKPEEFTDTEWGYIGESSNDIQTPAGNTLGQTKAPFFKSINVYGFNQHNFVSYKLINPIITRFGHDTYDYSQTNGTMQNSMTIGYETVKYYSGAIEGGNPSNLIDGFGESSSYDLTLSPIARPGSQNTILGQGGLVAAAGGVLDDLNQVPPDILGAIQKAGRAYNTFPNSQSIVQAAKAELTNQVYNAVKSTPNRNNIFNFPSFDQTAANIKSTINTGVNTVINKASAGTQQK